MKDFFSFSLNKQTATTEKKITYVKCMKGWTNLFETLHIEIKTNVVLTLIFECINKKILCG